MKTSLLKKQLTSTNIFFLFAGLLGWALLGSTVFAVIFCYTVVDMIVGYFDNYYIEELEKNVEEVNSMTQGDNVSNNSLLQNKDKIFDGLDKAEKSTFWSEFFFIGKGVVLSIYLLIMGIYFTSQFFGSPAEAPLFMEIITAIVGFVCFIGFIYVCYTEIKAIIEVSLPKIARNKLTSMTLRTFVEMIEKNPQLQTDTTTEEARKKNSPQEEVDSQVDFEDMTQESVMSILEKLVTDEMLASMKKREEFAKKYCEKKGWGDDFANLTLDQIEEIRDQEEWKNA